MTNKSKYQSGYTTISVSGLVDGKKCREWIEQLSRKVIIESRSYLVENRFHLLSRFMFSYDDKLGGDIHTRLAENVTFSLFFQKYLADNFYKRIHQVTNTVILSQTLLIRCSKWPYCTRNDHNSSLVCSILSEVFPPLFSRLAISSTMFWNISGLAIMFSGRGYEFQNLRVWKLIK